MNAILTTPSKFLASRQAAWDKFAESRRRIGMPVLPDGLARKAHDHAFEAGYLAGILKQKAEVVPVPAAIKPIEGKLQDLILTSLKLSGPASAETMAKRIGRNLNSVSPRFITMYRKGLVHVHSGEPAAHGKGVRNVYAIGNGVV